MGIFSFLKKIFSEPEKTEPITRNKIGFSEIEDFIKKKIDETTEKEKEIITLIKDKITIFTSELKDKIKILEEVNFEAKDKNEKIKSATHEGRKKYIEFLERFIENLETINQTSLEKVTEEINTAFTRFNETSGKSYERATILIGKEMGNIKETMKKFSSELINIFNENKEIITNSKRFSLINSQTNEIEEINKNLIKIDEELSDLASKINDKARESKEISENIEKIKNSAEYLENIEKEKFIQIEEEEIEKEILNLKQLINFKALSNFFHIFEDKMAIVKLHKNDFSNEFKSDEGNRLLNLLNESKLNTEKINNTIKNIQEKEREIERSKKIIKKDETQPLEHELEKINQEVQGFMNEIGWAEKKGEKLQITKNETIKLIKDELNLIGVDLED